MSAGTKLCVELHAPDGTSQAFVIHPDADDRTPANTRNRHDPRW